MAVKLETCSRKYTLTFGKSMFHAVDIDHMNIFYYYCAIDNH
jgi:hypothetical protein